MVVNPEMKLREYEPAENVRLATTCLTMQANQQHPLVNQIAGVLSSYSPATLPSSRMAERVICTEIINARNNRERLSSDGSFRKHGLVAAQPNYATSTMQGSSGCLHYRTRPLSSCLNRMTYTRNHALRKNNPFEVAPESVSHMVFVRLADRSHV